MKVLEGSAAEERPARGRRILCLDGGGIRGIMELIILQEIEKKTGKKIHELFDLVGGTSTGGIIALVLGLNLQGVNTGAAKGPSTIIKTSANSTSNGTEISLVERTVMLYEQLAVEVFGSGHWWSTITKPYWEYIAKGGAAYSSSKLANLMQTNMKPHIDKDFNFPLKEYDERMNEHSHCKTFVVATCSYAAEFMPFLLRSYKNDAHVDLWGLARQPTFHAPLGSQFDLQPLIWEAARCTSAAPTYFEPMEIGAEGHPERKVAFVDGGMVANNPAQLAIFEAHSLWPNDNVDCLVSLGTGSNLEKVVKDIQSHNDGVFKACHKIAAERGVLWGDNGLDIATSSEYTHSQVRNWIHIGLAETAYFRFNPQNLDENIDLAEYRPDKLKQLMDKANDFVKDAIVQQEIEVLVSILLCEPGWRDKLRNYRRHGVPGLQGMPNASRIG